ncbi:DUF6188 family protein [Curtobacterium sp. VKM Ac-1393]|uniref:DUF6188 family protein n=1 Tax=Curtobacterium sp. VKM Ac-1393 TaxID=2783814 RepID=UPI00188B28D7|nr:DUF6188 family protein [Curtobacterium sp. VKM Ac-1393]MBF4606857.1 hypothetical protein [Curtobacterium sp. VKM Ac-1393]
MDEHPRPRALSLAGETVDFVGVDYMVTLRFSNNASTAFEAAFTVREPGGPSFEVIPDGDKASLVPALRLRTETVIEARIKEEFHIRSEGGPTNKSNPDGLLSNRRHQMSDKRYNAVGGDPY